MMKKEVVQLEIETEVNFQLLIYKKPQKEGFRLKPAIGRGNCRVRSE